MKPAAFLLALSLVSMTALPAAASDDPAAPVLVEIQPTPEDEEDDEPPWIELVNPTPVELSLDSFYLTDRDPCFAPGVGYTEDYRWDLDVTLAPGERLVVELPEEGNCLTLAEGGDTIYLEDENGRTLQTVAYGDEGSLATPTPHQSLSACHSGNLVHGNWSLAQASPGEANPTCESPLA